MGKVYVVQEVTGKNVLSANKFGELTSLLPANKQICFSAGAVTSELKSKLSNFSNDDYLLLIGDPIAIGIATAMACHWNNGKVKLLKWDKQEFKYYEVSIDIYQKENLECV